MPKDTASKLDELYEGFKDKFSDVPEVTVEVLHGWLNANRTEQQQRPVLVDVRTHAEQQVSMLPGPDTLTQQQFEERGPDAFRGRRIVCYCGLFAAKLRRHHGLDAYNLRGSILAWTQAGYPLADPRDRAPTERVHVFSKDWALQGEGYVPVMFQRPAIPVVVDMVGSWMQAGLRLLSGRRGKSRPAEAETPQQR